MVARNLRRASFARLRDFLSEQFAAAGELLECRKFEGGQSNPTYLLVCREGKFVLRARPGGRLLKSAHAIDREFRVLRALMASAVPVPTVHLYCDDESVIGSAFYLMDHVDGRSFCNPELPEVSGPQRSAMYASMNETLAALSQVDIRAVGLGDFGRPDGFFERQVRRWTDQYRAAATERRDHMESLIEWLPAHLPGEHGQAGLMHGDYRLDNMVFDNDGRVVAVLDWELSTIGHPHADLAYQCAQWRLPTGAMRGLAGLDRQALGIPSEDEYVESFCRRTGLATIPDWDFLLALSLFRLASICQGVYRRGLDGNASSPLALEFGARTAVIAEHAVGILASGSCQSAAPQISGVNIAVV
jgi:aminoglycoside phosphotransferase (APT) family kinase protein